MDHSTRPPMSDAIRARNEPITFGLVSLLE